VYKINDPLKYVYIIKNGEFEVMKNLPGYKPTETSTNLEVDVFGQVPDSAEKEYYMNRRSRSLSKTKFLARV
jgi:CRP-like cAMP-binding protein